MTTHVIAGNPPISVILRRSARARRISLRVSRLDGRVTLTLPRHVSDDEALRFAYEKETWLRKNVAQTVPMQSLSIGGHVLFEGQNVPIQIGRVRTAKWTGAEILVPDDPARVGPRIAALMKTHARNRLSEASDRYAARIGRSYGRITIRDTRSRWGSCSSDGDLMYSWRLIMAPPEVLDYVAAHEVSHLIEMNHSPAYWKIVEGLDPDYRPKRKWLRDHGTKLHAYQFKS